MQLVRHVTPNECIATLKTNNCNKADILNFCQNRQGAAQVKKQLLRLKMALVSQGSIGLVLTTCWKCQLAPPWSINLQCFLAIGRTGLMELQWQAMVAKCKKHTECA